MDSIRIWRSPNTRFGKFTEKLDDINENETITANEVYTDDELAKIAASGFNAIWVHGLLRNIVKSNVFPEFGKNSELHQKNMNELIKRADSHRLKVFIYMQPPRGIAADNPFWKKHPEIAGTSETIKDDNDDDITVYSFCTSTDKAKEYLKSSASALAKELPGLGGIILITASEYPSHCWGRGGYMIDGSGYAEERPINCPRCSKRNPTEIVNEIIQLLRDGIKSISEEIEIIAWNWSWMAYEKDPSPNIINNLPKDVIYMAGFERGATKDILGKKRAVDEYSLSYSGPSKRFKNSTACAKKAGLRVVAKLQIGTTHELATVPNLSLIGNLYDKAKYIRENDIAGFMGCWNFGNMISANTAAFNYFLTKKELKSKKAELSLFAAEYFSGCDSKNVTEAWLQFAKAMDFYPFSIPFLYSSPINYTLAHPLKPEQADNVPCGRSWLMDKVRGDMLDNSFGEYTLEEIVRGLGTLAREWKKGALILEKALSKTSGQRKEEELNCAWMCHHVFRSAWNTYRAYKLRRKWSDKKLPEFLKIAKDEAANLKEALPLAKKDKRLGFHGEAFCYMFNEKLIRKKLRTLE